MVEVFYLITVSVLSSRIQQYINNPGMRRLLPPLYHNNLHKTDMDNLPSSAKNQTISQRFKPISYIGFKRTSALRIMIVNNGYSQIGMMFNQSIF